MAMKAGWLVQILGVVLILAALVDVYLTVLYARVGSGITTPRLARGRWWLFKRLGSVLPRWRNSIYTFCAPTLLVVMVGMWVAALTVVMALIVWSKLGTSVRSPQGATAMDFVTALA